MAVDSCACSRGALKRALISSTCGVRLSGIRRAREEWQGVGEELEGVTQLQQRSCCVINAFKSTLDKLTCSNDMCCCCCAISVQSWPLAAVPHSFHARAIKQNEKCCCKKQSAISGTRWCALLDLNVMIKPQSRCCCCCLESVFNWPIAVSVLDPRVLLHKTQCHFNRRHYSQSPLYTYTHAAVCN